MLLVYLVIVAEECHDCTMLILTYDVHIIGVHQKSEIMKTYLFVGYLD